MSGLRAGVALLEVVEAAIRMGDWSVDGRCDPDMAIRNMKQFIAEATEVRANNGGRRDDAKDAERWRHARRILPVEYIEESQRSFEKYGLPGSEKENLAADKAIDAAIKAQGETA